MPSLRRLAAALAALLALGASSTARRHSPDPSTPAGLSAVVATIHRNAERIRQLTPLFFTPGYPREDPIRDGLIQDNRKLLAQAGRGAEEQLAKMGDEPPRGRQPFWQLLRDTVSDAHDAALHNWYDFRDSSVEKRWAGVVEADKPPK